MPRLQPVDPKTATGKAKELLDAVKQKMGKVPNVLCNHGAGAGSARGVPRAQRRAEGRLAVAAAGREDCARDRRTERLLLLPSRPTPVIGKMSGLTEEQITQARQGKAGDAKEQAAVTFALQMIEKRGQVNDDDVAAVKSAGYTDGEVAEIVGAVALNVLTNYFNHVADTEIDFPKVSALCNKGGCCGGH